MNAAMTWDRKLMYERGYAMGEEFKGKGINVALGPVVRSIPPSPPMLWYGQKLRQCRRDLLDVTPMVDVTGRDSLRTRS